MAVRLKEIVPFGRSLGEYRRLFALGATDLAGRILGVGDGPASFNAEMHQLGQWVVSVDPLYGHRAADIESRFAAVAGSILAQVEASPRDWVWTYHRSPADLRRARHEVLQRFLADYSGDQRSGRYVAAALPHLPFAAGSFDLALCSHLLFLYGEQLPLEFHRAALLEMLRVADEVRVFPLLTLAVRKSPFVAPLIEELGTRGFTASVERVNYLLQRGGNEMLRIRRKYPPAEEACP